MTIFNPTWLENGQAFVDEARKRHQHTKCVDCNVHETTNESGVCDHCMWPETMSVFEALFDAKHVITMCRHGEVISEGEPCPFCAECEGGK